MDDKSVESQEPELCSCGYPDNSFACRIRHINVATANSESAKHDKEIRARRQESIYGV